MLFIGRSENADKLVLFPTGHNIPKHQGLQALNICK